MADAAKKDDDYKDDDTQKGRRARKGEVPPQFKEQQKNKDDDGDDDKKASRKSRASKADGDDDDKKPWEKACDGDDDEMDKKASRKSRKSDDGDDDADDDAADKARKSEVTPDDLAKSLGALSKLIQKSSGTSRKEALLEKASQGELSKSENKELFGILGGARQDDGEMGLERGLHKSMNDGGGSVPDVIDASEYIAELHDRLNTTMGMLAKSIVAMDERQQEFNLLLGRVCHQSGSMVKSMSDRIGVVEAQPARGPKSAGVGARALNKSFAGTAPAEDQMHKSEVLETLTALNQQSWEQGRQGLSKSNENITLAVSKYEATSRLSPTMLQEVRSFARANRANR